MSLLISQRSRKALPAAGIGKGCIRFQKPAEMDFAVLEKLLRRTAESPAAPC